MENQFYLFLDDIRHPFSAEGWTLARSSKEAIQLTKERGFPNKMSLDHDLGEADTTMIYLKWLAHELKEGRLSIPENFTYKVHSMNPVGKENLISFVKSLLKVYER